MPLSEFNAHHSGRHGKQTQCKSCDAKRGREWLQRPGKREQRARTTAAWYRLNKDAVLAAKAQLYREQRARYLVWQAHKRAKRKKIAFDLNRHVAEIQARIDAGQCELTGIAFDMTKGRTFASPSIDRIDSAGGYTYANVRIICHAMNSALGDWGEEPFRIVAEAYLSALLKRRNLSGCT